MCEQNKNFAGKEIFQRMNYLYQISELTMKKANDPDVKTDKKCWEFISNYYSEQMVNIGKKSVLRLDVDIKRTICKGCHRLLLPGKTARVRLKKKPQKHVRWTCLHCGSWKIFNTKEDYKVWSQNPDALVDNKDKTDPTEKTVISDPVLQL